MEIEPRNIVMSFTLILLLFGAADVLLVAQSPVGQTTADVGSVTPPDGSGNPDDPDTPPVATTGIDITPTVNELGLTAEDTNEPTFLGRIIPSNEANVELKVILSDGDRAGSVSWVDTDKVRLYYFALKEALHDSFTSELMSLSDETQRNGQEYRNYLSFVDEGISDERITFIRYKERMYEIHIAPGKEAIMNNLADTLTKWPTEEVVEPEPVPTPEPPAEPAGSGDTIDTGEPPADNPDTPAEPETPTDEPPPAEVDPSASEI